MISDLRRRLDMIQGQRQQTLRILNTTKEKEQEAKKHVEYCEKAQVVIQKVARQTQEELEYQVSELVTLAMSAVFPDPYELKLEFNLRRGRTEADISFVRDGVEIDPMSASGGGAVDVASFALQVSLWSLQVPRNRRVLYFDEPLKFLKGKNYPEKGARMIKEISKKLGIQILMVSHSPELIEGADRVFRVTNKKGISLVT